MKKIWSLWLCLLWVVGHAQNVAEGVTYCLPKTAIQVRLLVEKTVYTPGDLAAYGEKYLKLQHLSRRAGKNVARRHCRHGKTTHGFAG